MVNQKDATKILNAGKTKFTTEQVLLIRDFLLSLAEIEYSNYINENLKEEEHDECYTLYPGEYRRAS
jgi:hypothetical protein